MKKTARGLRATPAATPAAAPAAATGPQTGDVIFFHGAGILARLIRIFDGQVDWNHCGHLIGADDLAEIDTGVPIHVVSLKAKLASYGKPGDAYAGVFRLKTVLDGSLTDMQPLMISTNAIVAQAPAYGYDAIILLFLLSITRKVPAIPWWGRLLITLVGKRVAGLLLDLEHRGQAPLICSAFTHLAFDAVATDHARFAVDVPAFRAMALAAGPTAPHAALLVPEPGSILAEHMKARAAASQPGFRRMQLAATAMPTDAEIEAAGVEFLRRAAGRRPTRPPRVAAVLSGNDDLARSIETVLQFYPAVGGVPRSSATLRVKAVEVSGQARLISPGDLSVSESLTDIGRIATDGTFTPA